MPEIIETSDSLNEASIPKQIRKLAEILTGNFDKAVDMPNYMKAHNYSSQTDLFNDMVSHPTGLLTYQGQPLNTYLNGTAFSAHFSIAENAISGTNSFAMVLRDISVSAIYGLKITNYITTYSFKIKDDAVYISRTTTLNQADLDIEHFKFYY